MSRTLMIPLAKSSHLTASRRFQSAAILSPIRMMSNSSSGNLQDQDEPSSSDPLIRKLEDVIRHLIVRRSAPDWLPFLPGSSYWVPPQRSDGSSREFALLVEKLARPVPRKGSHLSSSSRGWPSQEYFVHGINTHNLDSSEATDKIEVVISTPLCDSEDEG